MTLSIWIHGRPKAQPRPRVTRNGTYTPKTANEWKQSVALSVKAAKPVETFLGPVAVSLAFHLPRPKRLMRAKDPEGTIEASVKPDIDNLVKAVMDAITDTGVIWKDDCQVYQIDASKWYHAKNGDPGCWIRIREATGQPLTESERYHMKTEFGVRMRENGKNKIKGEIYKTMYHYRLDIPLVKVPDRALVRWQIEWEDKQ